MSELLDRAEAYYLVAKETEIRGHEILRMAKELYEMADRLSEENSRGTPLPGKQPDLPAKRGRKPKAPKIDASDLSQPFPGSQNTSNEKP